MTGKGFGKIHIREAEFVVFDTETTGLGPKFGDEIIELAAVRMKGGKVIDRFCSFVNPRRPISPGATAVNGITDDMVKEAPYIEEVLPKFLEFAKESILVAHNASFDMGFLLEKMRQLDYGPVTNYVLDTLALSRKLHPDERSHSLSAIRRRLNVDCETEHRAMGDVVATGEILVIFLDRLMKGGAETLKDLFKAHGGNPRKYIRKTILKQF
jgi:DNA polymerase III subunit alpha, Gram-positive type